MALRAELRCRTAVLDGELVCLDDRGRLDFYALMYRRGTPSFVAFDVLAVNGLDVRAEPLIARKRRLRVIVPAPGTSVLAPQPIIGTGSALFDLVCEHDPEGVVAKRLDAPYRIVEPLPWRQIKNPNYSQAAGRHVLFERTPNRRALKRSGYPPPLATNV